jgi:hypothetical protein
VSSHAIIAALATVCALGAAGCEATFTPTEPIVAYSSGPAVVTATVVPDDIWAYPRVYFGGTYVYLVNGYWYQPTRRGWVVYRREPVELARERTRLYAAPGQRWGVRPQTPPSRVPTTPGYGYPRAYPRQEPYEYNRERTPNP